MESWILVIGIFFADHDEVHAKGPFSSEGNCQKLSGMLEMRKADWVSRCMPLAEFHLYYPDLELDRES